jgi:hypothetical protein
VTGSAAPHHVLVTGATGFVGRALIDRKKFLWLGGFDPLF